MAPNTNNKQSPSMLVIVGFVLVIVVAIIFFVTMKGNFNPAATSLQTTIAKPKTATKPEATKSVENATPTVASGVKKIVYSDSVDNRNFHIDEADKGTKFKIFRQPMNLRGNEIASMLYMRVDVPESKFIQDEKDQSAPIIKAYKDVNFGTYTTPPSPPQYEEIHNLIFEDGIVWMPMNIEAPTIPSNFYLRYNYKLVVIYNNATPTTVTENNPAQSTENMTESTTNTSSGVKKIVYADSLDNRNFHIDDADKETKFKIFRQPFDFRGNKVASMLYMRVDVPESKFIQDKKDQKAPIIKAYKDVNFGTYTTPPSPPQYEEIHNLIFEDGIVWMPMNIEAPTIPSNFYLQYNYKLVVLY